MSAFRELVGCAAGVAPTTTDKHHHQLIEDSGLCRICLDRPRRVLLLPCGHFHFCAECATALRECPICRRAVESSQTVFA
jgi:hypothetical protein